MFARIAAKFHRIGDTQCYPAPPRGRAQKSPWAGAIFTPMTLTLISDAFQAEKRGGAIGLWGAVAGLAVAAGRVVGGAVVSGIDWQTWAASETARQWATRRS